MYVFFHTGENRGYKSIMQARYALNSSEVGDEKESWSSSSAGGLAAVAAPTPEFPSRFRSQHHYHYHSKAEHPPPPPPPAVSSSEHRHHHHYLRSQEWHNHNETLSHPHLLPHENFRLLPSKTLGIGECRDYLCAKCHPNSKST